jgi:hypothetical protein
LVGIPLSGTACSRSFLPPFRLPVIPLSPPILFCQIPTLWTETMAPRF